MIKNKILLLNTQGSKIDDVKRHGEKDLQITDYGSRGISITTFLGNYLIQDMSGMEQFQDSFNNMGPVILPIVIAGVGIISSIIGTFFVRINDNSAKESKVQAALDKGNWISILITLFVTYFLIKWMLPDIMKMKFFGEGYKSISNLNVFFAFRRLQSVKF